MFNCLYCHNVVDVKPSWLNEEKWLFTLEEISTQNGPPKENNKIIVKIIK